MGSNLRRRLHHGDVDGGRREHFDASGYDGLDEPLLGGDRDRDLAPSDKGLTLEDIWDAERLNERLHWTLLFSQLISQWAQWLANIVFGSGSLIGRLLPFSSVSQNGSNRKLLLPSLSPLQEVRLRNLQQRLGVPFDGSRVEHQDALRQLWRLAYPDRELPSLKSEMWKDMGWQGSDPSTDFRGGGFISLENLIFFAQKYPNVGSKLGPVRCYYRKNYSRDHRGLLFAWIGLYMDLSSVSELHDDEESFQRLLHKKEGSRAEWEYPFAVAGINISFMLVQMLDIQSGKPSTPAGIRFLDLLADDEQAFDKLFCLAFQMMDAQWLAKRASYMEFNDVLKSTKSQLERELAIDDVYSVRDLPAYNMLRG